MHVRAGSMYDPLTVTRSHSPFSIHAHSCTRTHNAPTHLYTPTLTYTHGGGGLSHINTMQHKPHPSLMSYNTQLLDIEYNTPVYIPVFICRLQVPLPQVPIVQGGGGYCWNGMEVQAVPGLPAVHAVLFGGQAQCSP